ncbi:MAG: Cof-type HAD-IIB family hydrolase [Solobacterium sp.]|nr:Cof-type HAD-IIB family hydrolase [Solobacterium sp.]
MIKAVFLDMDDTLYSHTKGGIPSSAIEAMKQAGNNGIKIYGATGRHKEELRMLKVEDIPVDGWVTVNGAYSYEKDRVLDAHPIQEEDIRNLYAFLKEHPYPVVFLEAEKMYINVYDDLVQKDMDKIHTPYPDILPLERILEHPIYQCVPYVNEEVWKQMSASLHHIHATRWNIALDVIDSDAGKDVGIRKIREIYHWKREEIMAIGDGPNDISMMKEAGIAVCMGNGTKSCKEAADYVTDVIDCDGIMKAFRYFQLI